MSTEPNQKEIDLGTPTITLAGKVWPVPFLPPRQQRTLVPAISRITKRFSKLGAVMKDGNVQIAMLEELDESMMNDLYTMGYLALSKAHPQLLKAEFEELPISVIELINAIVPISQQTGLYSAVTTPEDLPFDDGTEVQKKVARLK